MKLRCMLRGHEWGRDYWRWYVPGESYAWFKKCERCGKRESIERHDTPPSHFVVNKHGVLQEILNAEGAD